MSNDIGSICRLIVFNIDFVWLESRELLADCLLHDIADVSFCRAVSVTVKNCIPVASSSWACNPDKPDEGSCQKYAWICARCCS